MTRIAAGLAASVFAILTVSAAGAVAKDATPPGDETTTATQPGAPGEQATRRAPEPKAGLSLTLVDYDGRTAPTEADAIDVGTSGPVLVRIKNTGEVPLEHLELTTAVAHGADDYLVGFVCPPAMFDPKANVTLAVGETIECGGFVTPIPGGPKAVVTGKVVATVEGASDIVEAAAAYWAYTPAAPTKPAAGAPTKPAAGAPATPATRTLPETGAGGAGLYAGIAAALAAAGVTVTVLMARVRRPR